MLCCTSDRTGSGLHTSPLQKMVRVDKSRHTGEADLRLNGWYEALWTIDV